jgi:hypothetical protein
MATSTSPTTDNQAPAQARLTGRRLLILAVAALALAALAGFGWFWRHPGVFPEWDSGGVGITLAAGHHIWFGTVDAPAQGDPRTLTLHSAEPLTATAPPGTKIRVLVCHGHPIGGAYRLTPWCTSTEPVLGAHLRIGKGATDQIVVRIASDHPGRVVVHGLRLTYSVGWQTGDQITGMNLVAKFTE